VDDDVDSADDIVVVERVVDELSLH